jgi:selenide,water dikinase
MLKAIPRVEDPNLLVGFETSDDAAVYRISDELALISTADYITPPVDDPWWFGQIAAANALSDVYAMGGMPLTALNLVMFPERELDAGVLRDILIGGAEKVAEAGAALVGGHSVDAVEPMYGLAVTGSVHPGRVLTNTGARAGDALVLTKPIGSGVLFNARLAGKATMQDIEPVLIACATLNRAAMDEALRHGVHACTDLTGFGVAGHALELARGSGLALELEYKALPLYEMAVGMYGRGVTTRSNTPNRAQCAGVLEIKAPLSGPQAEMLFDPQTSGGLLLALPEAGARALVDALRAGGMEHAAVIGRFTDPGPGSIRVV